MIRRVSDDLASVSEWYFGVPFSRGTREKSFVVDKNYIKAQKYLTMKRKLRFYWLIVFITMTTPIFSHVKDKNDMFTACGEDVIF